MLDSSTTLADDNARASGVDVDLALGGSALYVYVTNASVLQLLFDVALQSNVFVQPLGVVFLLVPLG